MNGRGTCPLEVQCAEPWAFQCFVVFTLFQKPGGGNDVTEKVRTHLGAGPNENHAEPGAEVLCGAEGARGPHGGTKGPSQLRTVLKGHTPRRPWPNRDTAARSGYGHKETRPALNQKLPSEPFGFLSLRCANLAPGTATEPPGCMPNSDQTINVK